MARFAPILPYTQYFLNDLLINMYIFFIIIIIIIIIIVIIIIQSFLCSQFTKIQLPGLYPKPDAIG